MLERDEAGASSSKTLDNMANMAGIITISKALSVNNDSTQVRFEKRKENWIIDSGATCHMTYKLDRLCHASRCVNKMVYLPNGEAAQVSHTGCCSTVDGKILDNVLVVPAFKHNLLSVSKLTRQLNCSVNFFPEFFVLQDLSNGKVKGIGKEIDGLYYLPAALQCEEGKGNQIVLMTQCSNTNKLLWHNRLGHPSTKMLQHLFIDENFSDNDDCNKCSICPLAKQTRLHFQLSMSKALVVFDLIHLDVWRPYRIVTHNGFNFS